MKQMYSDTVKYLFSESLHQATAKHLQEGINIHFDKLAVQEIKESFLHDTLHNFSIQSQTLAPALQADPNLEQQHGSMMQGIQKKFSQSLEQPHETIDHHTICSAVFTHIDNHFSL